MTNFTSILYYSPMSAVNKLPETEKLETTEIYCLTVLAARILEMKLVGLKSAAPSRSSRGKSLLPFPA